VKVLVAGELNPDLILSGCSIFPTPGREVLADDLKLCLGSSSAICAVGLARLGDEVTFASAVGADFYGDYCVEALRSAGVDVTHVMRRADLKTGITVSITSDRDRALVTFAGSITALRPEDLPDRIFEGHDHVHVSSWFLQDGLRPGLKHRFAAARRAGLTTSLDCGYDPTEKWSQDLLDTLTEVDVFLPNESEILGITGCRSVEEGMRKLDSGHILVVVKLGAEGCVARWRGESIRVPACSVDVVDTTGAGDSFNAGFLHLWKRGGALTDCLRFAAACGALSTRGLGGTATQPDTQEVQRHIFSQHSHKLADRITITRDDVGC
jgi:sugar/nucleoside kinase (ribokinase family)